MLDSWSRSRSRGRGTGRGGSPAPRRQQRMLQTGSSTKAFLSRCLRLPWKMLDLFAQMLNQNMWSTPHIVNMIKIGSIAEHTLNLVPPNHQCCSSCTRTSLWLMCMHILLSLLSWTLYSCQMKKTRSTDTLLTQGIVQNILPRDGCQPHTY